MSQLWFTEGLLVPEELLIQHDGFVAADAENSISYHVRFPTSPRIHYFSKHHVWSSFLSPNCHAQTIIMAPGTSSGWTDHPDHPLQTYEAVKAPARLRSYLSLKARARIMADPQRPKGTDSQTQDAKYPPAIRAVGCGLPLLTNSSTPAACRCWNKLAQISLWSLEPEQREGRRCGGGWRGRIFFFLFANIQFHHWQGWQMETN